jgi:CheY-like chemotaxis protein
MRPKVLIIEENEQEARSLASSLAAAAVEITDESAAIAKLGRGERYDLVLCDLGGHRAPSVAFSDALRRLSSIEETLLAVISDDPQESQAFSDAGVTVLGPHAGADDLRALLDFASSRVART